MLQTGFVVMTRPFLFGRLLRFHNEFHYIRLIFTHCENSTTVVKI